MGKVNGYPMNKSGKTRNRTKKLMLEKARLEGKGCFGGNNESKSLKRKVHGRAKMAKRSIKLDHPYCNLCSWGKCKGNKCDLKTSAKLNRKYIEF